MSEKEQQVQESQPEPGPLDRKAVSRREFLKIAGIAGATIGVGAGLGGLVAACGGGTTTTTTAATTATTAGATTTTAAAQSTTTVSSAPTTGRELKFGFMPPKTGNDAAFGTADNWAATRWQEFAKAGSMLDAKGVSHPMSIVIRDTQSDLNYGGTVAATLINNDKVDVLMAASTTDTTIPAALQAEALGCPCVLTDSPSDSLIRGVGGKVTDQFKWWYMAFWDNKGLIDCSMALFQDAAITTNKIVGCLWPNDVEGNDRRNFYQPPMKAAGLTVVDGGAFSVGMEDWGTIIAQFKKAGAEMITGLMIPPDWANFWKQCYQQSYVPKVADIGIQTLFPTTQEALGTTGFGLCGTSWWHPTNPFKSSLTGESCADLCLDYEKRTGQQWTQPQEHYMLFEWAVDALKRTNNVDDKEEIIKNVASTKMDTIVGPLDLTSAVDSGGVTVGQRCYPNVCFTPLWMGQWVKGDKQNPWSTKVWQYDLLIVENTCAPMLTDQAKPIVLPGTTFK